MGPKIRFDGLLVSQLSLPTKIFSGGNSLVSIKRPFCPFKIQLVWEKAGQAKNATVLYCLHFDMHLPHQLTRTMSYTKKIYLKIANNNKLYLW